MIKEKLNDSYRRASSSISSAIDDEAYQSIRSQLNKFEYECADEISYIMRQNRMPNNPSVSRNIESMIEDSKYQLKRVIANTRDQILQACQELYRGIVGVVESTLSVNQKKAKIIGLFEDYKSNVKSIHLRVQNMEFELFSEIDRYARRNFGDYDNLYYDLKDYFRRTERRFNETYSEAISTAIRESTGKIGEDLAENIIPYIKEEQKKEDKEEKLEEMKKDNNYTFQLKTLHFAACVGLPTIGEVADISDLDIKLYENYRKYTDSIQKRSDRLIAQIDQEIKNDSPDLKSKVSSIIAKNSSSISSYTNYDFSEGAFMEYVAELKANYTFGPNYTKFLDEAAQDMTAKYNLFVTECIIKIFKDTYGYLQQKIRSIKNSQTKTTPTTGTVSNGDEAPQGPKL